MTMEKKIQDYLHLYLGCEVMGNLLDEPRKGYLTGIHGEYGPEIQFFNEDGFNVSEEPEYNEYDQVKPILRPLSDMTDEEIKELDATKVFVRATPVHMVGNMQWTPESYRWVLSKGFDLFGLIQSGLAIDKTKLTAHA